MTDSPNNPEPPQPPPRAFTQGVGTVFQFTGVILFLGFFFGCCFSGLLSKDTATQSSLMTVGWRTYSAQRALSICVVVGVGLGLALASIGLGLQAQRRNSPAMAVAACAIATLFWSIHTLLFVYPTKSIFLSLLAGSMTLIYFALLLLAIAAMREMRRNPPPTGLEILPADYKIPYSHLHQDPPEVRLARELEERRQKLAVQQKELEALEQKLHRNLKQDKES